jgi:hypothetical protein
MTAKGGRIKNAVIGGTSPGEAPLVAGLIPSGGTLMPHPLWEHYAFSGGTDCLRRVFTSCAAPPSLLSMGSCRTRRLGNWWLATPLLRRTRRVKRFMRPLGDGISGGHQGAHGFGSSRRSCRSGLILPGAAARVWAYRIGTPREHPARRKRRSTTCGMQIVRSHLKSGPVQNTVILGTGNSQRFWPDSRQLLRRVRGSVSATD